MAELKLIPFPAHSLLPSSLYLLCRSSHSLHSQGWCRLNHVDAAIPNRSARLTLPLVHPFCSLLLDLPQSGVISLDALTAIPAHAFPRHVADCPRSTIFGCDLPS